MGLFSFLKGKPKMAGDSNLDISTADSVSDVTATPAEPVQPVAPVEPVATNDQDTPVVQESQSLTSEPAVDAPAGVESETSESEVGSVSDSTDTSGSDESDSSSDSDS